jgi:hypothetical protein
MEDDEYFNSEEIDLQEYHYLPTEQKKSNHFDRYVSIDEVLPTALVMVARGSKFGWSTECGVNLWPKTEEEVSREDQMKYDANLVRFLLDREYQQQLLQTYLPDETIFPMDVREWVKPVEVRVTPMFTRLDRNQDKMKKLVPLIGHLLGWKEEVNHCDRVPVCMYGFHALRVYSIPRGRHYRIFTAGGWEGDGYEWLEVLDLGRYDVA